MMMGYNHEQSRIMHVDLNSCFASVEQQSRPMLRGRPVAVVNRATEHTAIVTASYEAKARGVKVGMRFREARALVPDIIGIESDPAKYRYVYRKLLRIMQDYSAHVRMKSIDEGVIDFHQATDAMQARDMRDIGLEIKERLRTEVGDYMRCNVGIAPNRFLAKTAAGLHKPDGMDVIDAASLRATFAGLTLRDLTGIAYRNERRLNMASIVTPLEFLDAPVDLLRDTVFRSVVGEWWYKRLRGWEVDDVDYPMRRIGRQYVLESFNMSHEKIIKRLHRLCESVGSRMRSQNVVARGVFIYVRTYQRQYWHKSVVTSMPFRSDRAIYTLAKRLFAEAPDDIREIGVYCYLLEAYGDSQLCLFGEQVMRDETLSDTVDVINARYGERTIHAADTVDTGIHMNTKISFGGVRYL